MTEAPRISPDEVRRKLDSGEATLLVCAYEDAEKCRRVGVEGSIDFQQFQSKLPSLSKDHEIVFFCA